MINNLNLINEIDSYINSYGVGYSKWYCGITEDAHRRLYDEHNIPEDRGNLIVKMAANKTAAEMIEKHFLDKGCKGAQGGGNENSRLVYAYLITSNTKQ